MTVEDCEWARPYLSQGGKIPYTIGPDARRCIKLLLETEGVPDMGSYSIPSQGRYLSNSQGYRQNVPKAVGGSNGVTPPTTEKTVFIGSGYLSEQVGRVLRAEGWGTPPG